MAVVGSMPESVLKCLPLPKKTLDNISFIVCCYSARCVS
jgi:hypothetical protein